MASISSVKMCDWAEKSAYHLCVRSTKFEKANACAPVAKTLVLAALSAFFGYNPVKDSDCSNLNIDVDVCLGRYRGFNSPRSAQAAMLSPPPGECFTTRANPGSAGH